MQVSVHATDIVGRHTQLWPYPHNIKAGEFPLIQPWMASVIFTAQSFFFGKVTAVHRDDINNGTAGTCASDVLLTFQIEMFEGVDFIDLPLHVAERAVIGTLTERLIYERRYLDLVEKHQK